MSVLLSPIAIGSIEVKNRVVSTAHGAFLDFYRPGEPGERYIAYQEARARGGTGLIVLQPVHVHRTSQATGHYRYDRDDLAPKFRELADRLHRHGAKTIVQLMHFGAMFRSDATADLTPIWGFSPIVSPTGGEAAHEMTPEEIDEVIEGYAATAELAVECGLDGVELQGAHGYLLQQSLSPWANQRTDEWGDRHRFARAVVERIRSRIGDEPVLGVRLSVEDYVRPERGGLGPEGFRKAARMLVETGKVDVLNTSAGARAAHYARAIGSYRHPDGPLLPTIAALRAAIGEGVPVIGASRILNAGFAEQALADGSCDLVGMTRAQIADPELVAKIAGGRTREIRPCVGANQGCVNRMLGGLGITCFHNPDVGREHELEPLEPGDATWRVLVVGAGPAGLKAAEAAARAGHEVTVVDRASEPGGRLRLLGPDLKAAELLRSVRFLVGRIEALGVTLRLGVEADEGLIAAMAPDAVVLATGARPMPERVPAGDGSVPVVPVDEALAAPPRGRVVVVDHLGTEEVALAAEQLAATASAVTVLTPMQTVGPHIGFTLLRDQLVRLYELGCTLEANVAVTGIEAGEVVTRHVFSGETARWACDLVVAGVAGEPDLRLREAARAVARRVELAGDAVAPRTAMEAFREGDDAGRAIARSAGPGLQARKHAGAAAGDLE